MSNERAIFAPVITETLKSYDMTWWQDLLIVTSFFFLAPLERWLDRRVRRKWLQYVIAISAGVAFAWGMNLLRAFVFKGG